MNLDRRTFVSLLAIGGTARVGNKSEAGGYNVHSGPHGLDPWLEISAANLRWNLRQIQSRIGDKPIMAVVKANAYGHGLTGTARLLEGAGLQNFMVGKLEEACELRNGGVRGRILNFGPFSEEQADNIASLDISQNVFTDHVDSLDRAAKRADRRAFVHVKIDTGLGRFGVPHEQALRFLERVHRLQNVVIEGVFTTLTEDPDYDQVQLGRFHALCRHAADAGIAVGLRHAASSGAICDTPNAFETLDMVRPGTMLYGLYPSLKAERERKLDLRPILTLKARVAYVKTIGPGDSSLTAVHTRQLVMSA
ncbi:MAG: alanine racemase [Acidobacteria bacterium]|nr:alanine racemase [Acidobacteriota bacterium]